MFGLSMWEIAIIALVILFVVGPKRLPDVAKSIGKGYGEFKRTFNEMKQTVNVNDNNIRTSNRTKETSEDIKYSLMLNSIKASGKINLYQTLMTAQSLQNWKWQH